MDNYKSPYILSSASNFLGLCFIVLTSIKFFNLLEKSIIDEVIAVAALIFMTSCIFSFLSMRSKIERKKVRYENIADYLFMSGLVVIYFVTIIIVFDFM